MPRGLGAITQRSPGRPKGIGPWWRWKRVKCRCFPSDSKGLMFIYCLSDRRRCLQFCTYFLNSMQFYFAPPDMDANYGDQHSYLYTGRPMSVGKKK